MGEIRVCTSRRGAWSKGQLGAAAPAHSPLSETRQNGEEFAVDCKCELSSRDPNRLELSWSASHCNQLQISDMAAGLARFAVNCKFSVVRQMSRDTPGTWCAAGDRAQVLAEVNIGFGAGQLSAEAHLIDMVPACPLISLYGSWPAEMRHIDLHSPQPAFTCGRAMGSRPRTHGTAEIVPG